MQIKKLEIKELFGYINKTIDFNEDITLLVGINGAGKTSILNIINWLIRPSMANLAVTEFKSVKLTFKHKGKNFLIECKHLSKSLKYTIKAEDNSQEFQPLHVKTLVHPSNLDEEQIDKGEFLERYQHLTPTSKEYKTWEFIKQLPTPTIIGLDRNLYTEDSNKIYYEKSIKQGAYRRERKSKTSPLDRVKEIVNTEYRKSKNTILELTDDLKNHLMLSAFEGNIDINNIRRIEKNKLNLNQIETAEKRVNEYFQKYEQSAFWEKHKSAISKYFDHLKSITKEFDKNPGKMEVQLIYDLNSNQFIKLKKLLTQFERFEEKSKEARIKIDIFLEAINYFLKDSSKELLFKEDTSELVYNNLDKKMQIIKENRDISNLSSGEEQILVLFSYLAFNSSNERLFIIDEPELSLHIKWQEDFLTELEKITPNSTQIILATHSPILADKKKDKAIVLYPYNK